MSINVRNKGANGEREVADILQRVVNEVALSCGYTAPRIRRNVEQSQVGGEDLVGLPWFSFEVKRVERVELDKWWEQTCVQARRKAAGSTSWDALAKGGWRRLAAHTREEAAGQGSCGAHGREEGGQEAPGAGEAGQGGPWTGQVVAGSEAGRTAVALADAGAIDAGDARAVLGGPARPGLALPDWARGGSLGGVLAALERVDGCEVGRGGPTASVGSQRGEYDHRFDAARYLVATMSNATARTGLEQADRLGEGLARSNAEKPATVSAGAGKRHPVLIWRQNRQPWRVRCVLDVSIGFNVETRPIVSDVLLDDYLDVFRGMLRGYLISTRYSRRHG